MNMSKKDYNYIGRTISYKDKNQQSTSFKITQPTSNGFIQHVKVSDFEGNILGMENRTPGF